MLIQQIFTLLLSASLSSAWLPTRVLQKSTQLTMAGGRSPSEKLMTKKQLFRELRGKVNDAAKIPGFFDVGVPVVRL